VRARRPRALAAALALALGACDGEPGAADGRHDVKPLDDTAGAPDGTDGATNGATDGPTDAPEAVANNQLRDGITARIAHIVDGDTFDVIVGVAEPRVYTIRMRGLSAPECFKRGFQTEWGWRYACSSDDEPWGLGSYEALYTMLHGKTVWLTCDTSPGAWCPTDLYDRYLAYVELDGLDAATEMARGGHGFAYTDYGSSKRAAICRAEYEAQAAEVGVWALGSREDVLAGMHPSTRAWYLESHDARCDAAIAAEGTEP